MVEGGISAPARSGASAPGRGAGVVCLEPKFDAAGLTLAPGLRVIQREWRDGRVVHVICTPAVLGKALGEAYGMAIDGAELAPWLWRIAKSLDAKQGLIAWAIAGEMQFRPVPDGPGLRRAVALLKAEWDEALHPRQPAGAPDGAGGQFAPKDTPVDEGNGAETEPTPKERAAIDTIRRTLKDYIEGSLAGFAQIPVDVIRIYNDFVNDPLGTLRRLEPTLAGISPAVAEGSAAAARLIGALRGAGALADGAAGESADYQPQAAEPSETVGSRQMQYNPIDGRNEPAEIDGRPYSGHSLDKMQAGGVTPSRVENAIRVGQKAEGNDPGTTLHIDSENGLAVVTNDRTGGVVTVYHVERTGISKMQAAVSQRDRGICEAMLQAIRDFDEGRDFFQTLIDRLDPLRLALESGDRQWRDAVTSRWADLEITYALGLDRGQKGLTLEDMKIVDRAIKQLKALLNEGIAAASG